MRLKFKQQVLPLRRLLTFKNFVKVSWSLVFLFLTLIINPPRSTMTRMFVFGGHTTWPLRPRAISSLGRTPFANGSRTTQSLWIMPRVSSILQTSLLRKCRMAYISTSALGFVYDSTCQFPQHFSIGGASCPPAVIKYYCSFCDSSFLICGMPVVPPSARIKFVLPIGHCHLSLSSASHHLLWRLHVFVPLGIVWYFSGQYLSPLLVP